MIKKPFTLVLFLSIYLLATAQTKKNISIDVKDISLKEITKKIEAQTDYSFVYNESVDLSIKKSVSVKDKPLAEVLKTVFTRTGIVWKISGKHIVLTKQARTNVVVSGYVTDSESGETLIGATIGDKNSGSGGISNSYGYYSIRIPSGEVELQASYVGYKAVSKTIELLNDTVINFKLPQGEYLKEVVVTDTKRFSPSGSSIELSASDIKAMPAIMGEVDVIKSLQLLPGVQSGVEGTAGMYVRGGGADQNLYLLDGVSLYNTSHVFGLFSIFNGDAVKKVTLHKGSFPARFGGRLSSVVDIRLKDGDMYNYKADLTIGLLSSRLNVEGPIFKGKTSFNFSARRSYIDMFLRGAKKFTDDVVPILYFYDVNTKVNHKFSDKSRLYLSFYKGLDKIGYKDEENSNNYKEKTQFDFNWGNTVASARWNYVFSNKLFANTTLAYNKYEFNIKSISKTVEEKRESSLEGFQNSDIKDWSLNTDFEFIPNEKHHVRFGGSFILHEFKPEVHGYKEEDTELGININNKVNYMIYDRVRANEASLYAEDEFSVYEKFKANLGLHFSLFNVQGKTYNSLQPRISLGYELNDNWGFKASYTKMNQYINLLMSSMISMPTDLWVPITKNLKPMQAHQFTLGVHYNTTNGYKFSVEGFYKKMQNILEYKDGSSWRDAYSTWESQVEAGKGWSYGTEFFAQKTFGKFTGWLGYTLAWNERKFPTINHGLKYPAKYDRRHDISLTTSYKLNKKIELGASWMYATGNNTTIAFEEYSPIPSIWYEGGIMMSSSTGLIPYVSQRNNYRLPATHHLDLDMKYHYSPQKIWTFTIYNVYNQFNPYFITTDNMGVGGGKHKNRITQYSLLGIVPSVSFTYKFK